MIELLTVADAFCPEHQGWVKTGLLLQVSDDNISVDPTTYDKMVAMDGWVFDISRILSDYKLVDTKTYAVYDSDTKELKLTEAALFDNMKEL